MHKNYKSIIVKIEKDKLFFSALSYVELKYSNLPLEWMAFSPRPIFWQLSITGYDRTSRQLQAGIIQYDLTPTPNWEGTEPRYPINFIAFHTVDWNQLKQCLAYYKAEAKTMIPHEKKKQDKNQACTTINQTYNIRLNDLSIASGKATLKKKLKGFPDTHAVEILNPFLFPKLNYVKPYLASIIGKKTVEVEIAIKIFREQIKEIKAHSPDLLKINKESLYVIKNLQLRDIRKKYRDQFQENILVEAMDSDQDLILGNIDELEKELLFSLLEEGDILNSAQLYYLAEIMTGGYKLMLTVDPQFGFIFPIVGEEMVHYAWELINSHATYLWSMDRQMAINKQIKNLEKEFSILTTHGRSYYRQHQEQKEDLFFHVIQHKRRKNPMVDNLADWRLRLESMII